MLGGERVRVTHGGVVRRIGWIVGPAVGGREPAPRQGRRRHGEPAVRPEQHLAQGKAPARGTPVALALVGSRDGTGPSNDTRRRHPVGSEGQRGSIDVEVHR